MLSFQAGVAAPAAPSAQARLREELHAVQAGLEALSRSGWAEVADALRRVSFRSPFGHWSVFIKGVAAFHACDDERAVKLWQSLPPGSVPTKASQFYLLLLPDAPAEAATEGAARSASSAAVDGACQIIAGSAVELLMRANRLWQEGRGTDSYEALHYKLEGFPSVTSDWRGALTEFYFKAPHGMMPHDWPRYLMFFLNLEVADTFKDDIEAMFTLRMAALLGCKRAPVVELRLYWEKFLRLHQSIHGADPRLASLGYGWLGEQLSIPEGAHADDWEARDISHADYAIRDLERSIALDPTNLKAQLHLCKLYGILGEGSERYRLLDLMTKRFPDDKHVLVAAARGCIERNAFTKAHDYLARARQLDRLDPQIPRLLVAALEGQAVTYFQQHRPDDARQALALTSEWLTERPDDFQTSRWSASARHAAIDRLGRGPSEAEPLLAESLRLSTLSIAPLLIAHLTYRQHQKPRSNGSPFLPAVEKALGLHPTPQEIGVSMSILGDWLASSERFSAEREHALIVDALKKAAGRPFTRAEALDFIVRAGNQIKYGKALVLFVHKMLRNDPADPPFRLWNLKYGDGHVANLGGMDAELDSIIAEATRRRDETTLREARAMLRDLDAPAPDSDYDDFDDENDGLET